MCGLAGCRVGILTLKTLNFNPQNFSPSSGEGDAAGLLRLYLKYGKLQEAVQVQP
jgi:hypothetical protein